MTMLSTWRPQRWSQSWSLMASNAASTMRRFCSTLIPSSTPLLRMVSGVFRLDERKRDRRPGKDPEPAGAYGEKPRSAGGPYESSSKAFRTSINSVRPMVDLRTQIAGVWLRNPTMLASGFLDETGGFMARVSEAAAGGVLPTCLGAKPRLREPDSEIVGPRAVLIYLV